MKAIRLFTSRQRQQETNLGYEFTGPFLCLQIPHLNRWTQLNEVTILKRSR